MERYAKVWPNFDHNCISICNAQAYHMTFVHSHLQVPIVSYSYDQLLSYSPTASSILLITENPNGSEYLFQRKCFEFLQEHHTNLHLFLINYSV
jgi:hypothetical protein